jgi:hypothetical protein
MVIIRHGKPAPPAVHCLVGQTYRNKRENKHGVCERHETLRKPQPQQCARTRQDSTRLETATCTYHRPLCCGLDTRVPTTGCGAPSWKWIPKALLLCDKAESASYC